MAEGMFFNPGPPRARRRWMKGTYRSDGVRGLRQALTTWSRFPEWMLAMERLEALPQVTLTDIGCSADDLPSLRLTELFRSPGGWGLEPLERLALAAIVRLRSVTRVLEIGTFDGGTTAMLAEAVGPSGQVVTVDLPADQLSQMQLPPGFRPEDVGRVYRDAGLGDRVTQLRIDSVDLTPDLVGADFDVVFVDAGHDYPHGRHDAEFALQVVGRRGVVVFDDMHFWFGGLVFGVTDAAAGRDLRMLSGTKLAIMLPDPGPPSATTAGPTSEQPR